MLAKFWEGIGTDLAKKWLERIFSPAFIFWLGGASAYLFFQNSSNWRAAWTGLLDWFQNRSLESKGGVLVGGLLLVVISSLIMEKLHFPFLRFLEGYWPWRLNRFAVWIGQLRAKRIWKDELAYQSLQNKESEAKESGKELKPFELRELTRLEAKLHYVPVDPRNIMVSGLGDILRAGEGASYDKYGLDAIVCWPRLWVLLPEGTRKDITAAQQAMEQLVDLIAWGLLFLVWGIWCWWAIPLAVIWIVLAYSLSKQSAMGYVDLIETAFDLYRWELYKKSHFPLPARAVQEKEQGLKLTAYLWRGEAEGIAFNHQPE